MEVASTWLSVLSDLFANLAAGWLGAVLIVPLQAKRFRQLGFLTLTVNLAFAIVALVVSFEFRRRLGI